MAVLGKSAGVPIASPPASSLAAFPAAVTDGAARLRALFRLPLAVAPMAGGPSTVDLVVAGARAGALAFLAGGYQTAPALAEEMAAVRAAGVDTFGVNLFVPGGPTRQVEELAAYVTAVEPDATALGVALGEARWDDDGYPTKVDAVRAAPPAVVSFTFGIPAGDVVRAFQAAGSLVLITVTTPEEAVLALRAGPDALVLQGAEAGAHRGSLVNADRPDEDRPVRALLAAVRRRTLVPLVAGGGVAGPGDVADLLARGADMVVAGTAFLRCPESGAPAVLKEALGAASHTGTTITRAFSGRRARALVNAMVEGHPGAPAAYPEINNATRPLRAASARAGDTGHMSLYAGTGFHGAAARPAAEVVDWLLSGWPR
jgi:nitronate monooxygenase